jgi:hypothetical protein
MTNPLNESLIDLLNLLSHDRQHLDVDAIELVEAGPCASTIFCSKFNSTPFL